MLKKFTLIALMQLMAGTMAFAQCTEGNCFDGNGTFLYENGDLYKGLWRKGQCEGYGVYEFANGDVYKGNFLLGKMSGRGTYIYKNGDKYIGGWKEGKMEGRGHFYWSLPGDLMDNARYEGNFKAGKPANFEVVDTAMPAEAPKMK